MGRDARIPTTCRSCSKPIIWATIKETGKKCPYDATHDPIKGTHVLRYSEWNNDVTAEKVEPGSNPLARVSHFTTCEQAAQWSKNKKRRGGPPVRAGDLLPSGTKGDDNG